MEPVAVKPVAAKPMAAKPVVVNPTRAIAPPRPKVCVARTFYPSDVCFIAGKATQLNKSTRSLGFGVESE